MRRYIMKKIKRHIKKSSLKGNIDKSFSKSLKYLGLDARKPVFGGFANNTGADQPAHTRSLISAFVIRFLQSTICKLATDEVSIF